MKTDNHPPLNSECIAVWKGWGVTRQCRTGLEAGGRQAALFPQLSDMLLPSLQTPGSHPGITDEADPIPAAQVIRRVEQDEIAEDSPKPCRSAPSRGQCAHGRNRLEAEFPPFPPFGTGRHSSPVCGVPGP